MKEVIESIEDDIEKHRSDAGNMLGFVGTATGIVILVLFITVAPEMAVRFIPTLEKSVAEQAKIINSRKSEFELQYSKKHYHISEDDYEDIVEKGALKDIDKDARRISTISSGPTLRLDAAKVVSKMSIASEKSDLIFKAVPFLFIAVFAGSLFTYRFHMQIVRDLSMRRTDLLIANTEKEKPSNDATNTDN